VPRQDPKSKALFKCTMCFDRITNNMIPACVKSMLGAPDVKMLQPLILGQILLVCRRLPATKLSPGRLAAMLEEI
jgi:hypothetical protein